MDYLQTLQTPHPSRRAEGQAAIPLYDALALDSAAEYIDASRALGDRAYNQAVREVLPNITQGVHQALDYKLPAELQTDAKTDAFKTLANEQVTHCYGYAAVTSAALSTAGIKHWIAHAGTHAFTVVPLRETRGPQLLIADALKLRLTGDIAPALRDGTVADLAMQMNNRARPRGAALLDTRDLAYSQGFSTAAAFLGKYSFFTFRKYTDPRDERVLINHEKIERIVLSVLPPHVGALALKRAARFMAAAQHNKPQDAADALNTIAGLYPQIDASDKHGDIVGVVRQLCERRSFARARRAIQDYCSSFAISDDPRLRELEGDLWRIMADATKNNGLRARARAHYTAALQRTRFPWAAHDISAKLQSV